MRRIYRKTILYEACEHCDGEHSDWIRHDYLRGDVCPPCDEALDKMLNEHPCREVGA